MSEQKKEARSKTSAKAAVKKAGPSASKAPRTGKASGLLPMTVVACAGPIVLHVLRLVIDQEASGEAMLTLFVTAAFGLSALIGQKWAIRQAPAVFLVGAAPLVVYAIMGIAPAYWGVLLGLAWCIHELCVAQDIRENLLARAEAR